MRFKSTIKVLPIALALVFALEANASSQDSGRDVPFETVRKNVLSNIDRDENFVIKNKRELQEFKELLSAGRVTPDLPDVDFSQQMVIAIVRGKTAPLDVSIRRLVRDGKTLTVFAEEKWYNPACVYAAVVTRPYHIIVTEKVKKKVRKNISFEIERVIDADCLKKP